MAVKSKPVRIFADDDAALEFLVRLQNRSRGEIVHDALAEYVARHRGDLSKIYEETQQALAAGDLDALVRASQPALDAEVDSVMASMPVYQPKA